MSTDPERKKLLLVLTGEAVPAAEELDGDFTAMFCALLEGGEADLDALDIRDQEEDAPLPDVSEYAGVVMSGSAAMIGDDAPWMRYAVRLVKQLLTDEFPFLGVCFGHQILGLAAGADVGLNPSGREMGSIEVRKLSPARSDALFSAFPDPFVAQVSHRDAILDPGPRLEVLGATAHDAHHLVRYGESAWGVQYHPEFSADVMRLYLEARRAVLDEELGEGVTDARIAEVVDAPVAARTLAAFADLARRRRHKG